jgi:hypothetical protein
MDPLSTFTTIIRNLSRPRAERAGPQGSSAPTRAVSTGVDPVARTGSELRERLRSRLAALGPTTREHRCEVFVETVLTSELSDATGADPQFSELVTRVARELAADSRISARLDQLLSELPTASHY